MHKYQHIKKDQTRKHGLFLVINIFHTRKVMNQNLLQYESKHTCVMEG